MSRWGEAGPPDEAYSRVTDPARFAPLHAAGTSLVADLERKYDVTRETSRAPDPHDPEVTAPAVTLIPTDPEAAPLTVVTTSFPGLVLRFADRTLSLPECGCDACDETIPELTELLAGQVAALVAGTFGDRLVHEPDQTFPLRYSDTDGIGASVHTAQWWHEQWYEAADGTGGSSRTPVAEDQLPTLRKSFPAGGRTWHAWPPRP